MKTIRYLPWLILAAAVFPLIGCQPKTTLRVTVKPQTAQVGTIDREVEFSGVLVPDSTVNIFAKLAGQATFVGVDVGDHVKAGQLLV